MEDLLIGGRTRDEFVGMAAGMVMSSVLAKDAPLVVNADLRPEVLKRSSLIATQAAQMLWDVLVADVCASNDTSGLYAEFAIRNVASVLGWWSDLACRTPGERADSLKCAVLTSVLGAAALWKALGRT